MSSKGTYRTKQMSEMLSYLESLDGKHFTAADLGTYFQEKGISVGTTTIYRHLERMVEQGKVAKYMIDGSSSACFEYLGEGHGDHVDAECYHCKCEVCGKLIHLHCDEVAVLKEHIAAHHGFELNPLRTVFYGICSECRREISAEEKEQTEAPKAPVKIHGKLRTK